MDLQCKYIGKVELVTLARQTVLICEFQRIYRQYVDIYFYRGQTSQGHWRPIFWVVNIGNCAKTRLRDVGLTGSQRCYTRNRIMTNDRLVSLAHSLLNISSSFS